VPEFLATADEPRVFLGRLNGSAADYAGFNLLVGDSRALHYLSNRDDSGPRELEPGVYGLSNHRLDTPWPKLVRTRARFTNLLAHDDPGPGAFFDLLADREPATGEALPDSGLPPEWERAVSAPFVVNERYGTRCTTVLLVDHHGGTVALERRFDATGRQTGATRLAFAGSLARE
jgi:uncharacterized protein with NRDE domain